MERLLGGGRHRRRCCGPGPPGRTQVLKRRISRGSRSQLGLPRWHSGKESACQRRRHKRLGFDSWVGKILWRRKWQPAPLLLPGKFHAQKEPGGLQSWARRRTGQDWGLSIHTHTSSQCLMTRHRLSFPPGHVLRQTLWKASRGPYTGCTLALTVFRGPWDWVLTTALPSSRAIMEKKKKWCCYKTPPTSLSSSNKSRVSFYAL